jgi:hypothetical protein
MVIFVIRHVLRKKKQAHLRGYSGDFIALESKRNQLPQLKHASMNRFQFVIAQAKLLNGV